jgi:molybdate transport system substrate-binding protein
LEARIMRRSLITALAVVAASLILAAGCRSTSTSTAATAGSRATPVAGSITVSAASSLSGAFATIKDNFVKANPDATITINTGSSGQLESQIEGGAPADVMAFADEATMKKLSDKSLLAEPATVFATNQLIIVTKPGNPTGIKTLADLATAGVVSRCVETAPCGKYASQILEGAGVTVPDSSATRGPDVKTTLSAVTDGDAVAGIVYVTDAQAAGAKVESVAIPTAQNAVATYPVAVLAATKAKALAEAFEAYVLGPEGQAVLAAAGFGPP